MRVQKRNPWLFSLGVVLAAMVLWGSQAGADTTSDRPGSVVIWPKVISDGSRDTLITLTNTSNSTVFAHCVYVNAIGICRSSGAFCTLPSTIVGAEPACPGGPSDICDLDWSALDFGVVLTRQQPTIWRVSTGRIENPLVPADGSCENFGLTQSCPGIFMAFTEGAPGQVNPMGTSFAGELRCIQVDSGGAAVAGNALKGEAIIEAVGKDMNPIVSTQISEYNSVNIRASQPPFADPSILPLNGVNPANGPPPGTGDYNVYNACPESVEFTNYAVHADDLVAAEIDPTACIATGCPVTTEITILPCRVDFENDIATRFVVDIDVTNEFEEHISVGPQDFNCWTNFRQTQLTGFTNLGWTFQRTRINPSGSGLCIGGDSALINTPCDEDIDCNPDGTDGVCAPATAVLALVEEFHDTDLTISSLAPAGSDAANAFSVDNNNDHFLGKRGSCRGALTTRCTQDSECPTGKCRDSGVACTVAGGGCGAGDFCDQCMNDEIRFQPDVVVGPQM